EEWLESLPGRAAPAGRHRPGEPARAGPGGAGRAAHRCLPALGRPAADAGADRPAGPRADGRAGRGDPRVRQRRRL
ncbi:MAG: hypothetical protein AVDCRST_MAG41-4677, partial [uncultured Corynebacteriales bacterium]